MQILDRYTAQVHGFMQKVLTEPGFLYQKSLYHHGFLDAKGNVPARIESGKALRSTLLLLTIDALKKKKWTAAIPAGVALELFHNATLIVDDWQDKDALRRGRQAIWTLADVGPEQAINVAFFLTSLSSDVLLRLSSEDFSANVRFGVQSLFEQTKMAVIDGQQKDIALEKEVVIDIGEYMDMIWLKTGVFIQTAIVMGAVLGGADTKTLARLSGFGKALGLLFQMQDDYLGVFGDEEKMGKPAQDLLHRKKSLPVVLAYMHASKKDREELVQIYSKNGKELDAPGVSQVKKIFAKLAIEEKTRALVEKTYMEAIAFVSPVTLSRKADFLFLADLFAHREK